MSLHVIEREAENFNRSAISGIKYNVLSEAWSCGNMVRREDIDLDWQTSGF